MKNIFNPLLTFIVTTVFASSLLGQDYDLDITLMVPPPYPSNLDAYVDHLDQGIVQISNFTDETVEAYFEVSLADLAGRLNLSTGISYDQSISILPGTTVLTQSNISDIFTGLTTSNISTPGLSQNQRDALLLNKQLPEGSYKLCVFAFNEQGQRISDPEGNGCFEFEITFPERPIIDQPDNDDYADPSGFVNILWSHFLTDPEALNRIDYKLEIIDLTEQEIDNVNSAFLDPGIVPDFEENLGAVRNKIIQDDVEMPLIEGHKYGVRVTASDRDNIIAFQFGGQSEIVSFTYGQPNEKQEDDSDLISAPKITSPDDDILDINDDLNIKWEHDVSDKSVYKYDLRILEIASSDFNLQNFENNAYTDLVNTTIVSTDTTLLASDNSWIADKEYTVLIKMQSSNDSDILENGGFSNQVGFVVTKAPQIVTETKKDETTEECKCSDNALAKMPEDTKSVELKNKDMKEIKLGTVILNMDNKKTTGDKDKGYSGEGYISVKFGEKKNYKIKVQFEKLKVNKSKQVVEGTAKGMSDTDVKLDEKVANYLKGNGVLSYKEVAGITTYGRLRDKMERAQKGEPIGLPLGIDRDIKFPTGAKGENDKNTPTEKIVVGISSMKFTPTCASLTALFSLDNPDWGDQVPTLGASGICFTSDGLSSDFVKLYLGKDFKIDIKGEEFTLKASKNDGTDEVDGTFIKFGQKKNEPGMKEGEFGFIEGQLTAELSINRSALVPENKEGEILEGMAKLILSGTFKSKKNYILSASLSPCQIPGLEGFSFTLKEGVYDHSDYFNPLNIVFPEGHKKTVKDKDWQGIYFSEAKIMAPKEWGLADSGKRTEASLKNFIKDGQGVFVTGEAKQLLGIEKGSIEGFAISIDKMYIGISQSKLDSVAMEGRLRLPILPDNSYLNYVGIIDQPKPEEKKEEQKGKSNTKNKEKAKKQTPSVAFTITPDKNGYDIAWLKAHIDFDENSQFTLKKDEKEKGFKGELSGKLSLTNKSTDGPELTLPGIKFQNMKMSKMTLAGSKKPGKFKFEAPTFGQVGSKDSSPETSDTEEEDSSKPKIAEAKPTNKKINGFGMHLDKLDMKVIEDASGNMNQIVVNVDGQIMLVGGAKSNKKKKEKGGFSVTAKGSFDIYADVSGIEPRNMSIKYNRIQLNKFSLLSSVRAVSIKGAVSFYNEPTKKGMEGDLSVTMPLVKVDMKAKFGRNEVEDYNYWYLFGSAGKTPPAEGFPKPIKKLGPYVSLYGFHGGIYYHMEDKGRDKAVDVRYQPDNTVLLGLQAGVTLSVKKPKVLWGKTTLTAEFNDNGGLRNIGLLGDAYMLKNNMMENPIKKEEDGAKVVGVQALLDAKINFKDDSIEDFDARMDIYANVDNKFKGGFDQYNKVVRSTMAVKNGKWHLWIGQPSKRAAVKLSLADIAELDVGAYLMLGNKPMEKYSLPAKMKSWLGHPDFSAGEKIDFGKSTREFNTDFKFGLGAKVDYTLDLELAILYVNFQAMFGFDLALTKSRGGIVCANNDMKPKGTNGWYADGQIYGGFEGSLGVKVDLFFYSGRIKLAGLQAAMLIKGGLPNPSYVNGRASMKYEVMGGIISGRTSFDVKFGQQCVEVVTDELAGIKFVQDIGPEEGTEEVSVFVTPSISFASKVDDGKYEEEIYEIKIPNQALPSKFKVVIEEFKLYKTNDKSKRALQGKMVWDGHSEILFNAASMLDANTDYTLAITLKAKKYDYRTGLWHYYQKKDHTDWMEKDSSTFTTGALPDYIPLENFKLSYPFYYEKAYLPGENIYKEGFIALKNSQRYLFEKYDFTVSDHVPKWNLEIVARFAEYVRPGIGSRSPKIYADTKVTCGYPYNFLTFEVPRNLPKYGRVDIIITEKYTRNPDYKSKESAKEQIDISETTTITMNGKQYENASELKPPEPKTFFKHRITLSSFNTFKEKLTAGLSNPGSNMNSRFGTMKHQKAFNEIYIAGKKEKVKRLYGSGINYNLNIREHFSWAEGFERNVRASRSQKGPMMRVKEDYDQYFYKEMFDFFQFQRYLFADLLKKLPALDTKVKNYGDGTDFWEDYYKYDGNAKNHYSLKGHSYFTSLLMKHAELDADRIWDLGKSIPSWFKNKWYNDNMNRFFDSEGNFKVKPPAGKYSLNFMYIVPRIQNNKITEYRRTSQPVKVLFQYNGN